MRCPNGLLPFVDVGKQVSDSAVGGVSPPSLGATLAHCAGYRLAGNG